MFATRYAINGRHIGENGRCRLAYNCKVGGDLCSDMTLILIRIADEKVLEAVVKSQSSFRTQCDNDVTMTSHAAVSVTQVQYKIGIMTSAELSGCVKDEVAVLDSPSPLILMVSVEVKQH